MQTEIFNFWTFLSGLRAQTSTLERFLASVDLSSGENILNIREYSREYNYHNLGVRWVTTYHVRLFIILQRNAESSGPFLAPTTF